MFLQVSYWTAFTAGFLSFFSPCLLPLVPAYIMYLTGSFEADELVKKRTKAIVQTIQFSQIFQTVESYRGIISHNDWPFDIFRQNDIHC